MSLRAIIGAARGDRPCDLLLKNARIVDVLAGTIRPGSVALAGGLIAGFGDYPARRILDLGGRYLSPGFIDAHVHVESAMTSVGEFATAVAACGTTTVVADPHEIANVLGKEGLRYMLRAAEGQPANVFYALPACVPATALETSGAHLSASDLEEFYGEPRIVALGEMMNYPGVLAADPEVTAKLEAARRHAKPVDGHSPGLSGRDLAAYVAAGISSDHECTTLAEGREKLALGMHIMIRQGTAARNLKDLLPLARESGGGRLMWCTDDRHPQDLIGEGHIDALLREAVGLGLDPLTAVTMATLRPAERFGLHHVGAIAPGRQADLVVFSDLHAPRAEAVYHRGVRVAEGGRPASDLVRPPPVEAPPAMRVDPAGLDFRIPCRGSRFRVIEVVADQIVTRRSEAAVQAAGGELFSDPVRDLLKIAVVERHRGSGRVGLGIVRGLGLKRGAIASSVAHDSHNIIAAGVTDAEIRAAVAAVAAMGGGLAAVAGGGVLESLPLPIAGLMSPEPVRAVAAAMDRLIRSARTLGSPLKDPFMTLSFLALPVIPELKITDLGLVDVAAFRHVPLFL